MADIVTWADGFGIWHASVPLDDGLLVTAGAKAREAIRDEIAAREGSGFAPSRIDVKLGRITNHGTAVFDEVLIPE